MAGILRAIPHADPVTEMRRCTRCDTRFESEIVVNVPIDVYLAQLSATRCPNCGAGTAHLRMGEDRRLSEDREDREADGITAASSQSDRADWWRRRGDVCQASLSLHHHMTDRAPSKWRWPAPEGLGGVRRCMLLLDLLPEWRSRMHEMARHEGPWRAIAPRWERIAAALEAEAPDYHGRAEIAYGLLKDAIEDAKR